MATPAITPENPGYCEFCGPACSHCFDDSTNDGADDPTVPVKMQYEPNGGLAFDASVGKWVCAADYDYEANQRD